MDVTIILLPGKATAKRLQLQNGSTVLDILNKLNINPDTMIPLRNSSPLPIDERLKDGDVIELVRVVSGG
ncbi:MAG: MoaD/ThiS family protein [Thermoplasmata archaeon]